MYKYQVPFIALQMHPNRIMSPADIHRVCARRWPQIWNYGTEQTGIRKVYSLANQYPSLYSRLSTYRVTAHPVDMPDHPGGPVVTRERHNALIGYISGMLTRDENGRLNDRIFGIMREMGLATIDDPNRTPSRISQMQPRVSIDAPPPAPVAIRHAPAPPQAPFLFMRNASLTSWTEEDDDDFLYFPESPTPMPEAPPPEDCTICLDPIVRGNGGAPTLRFDSCGHSLHMHCWQGWITRGEVRMDKLRRCVRCQRQIHFTDPILESMFEMALGRRR